MAKEVLREKSNCVVCQSSTLRFLKQKHNRKKLKDNIIARLLFFLQVINHANLL